MRSTNKVHKNVKCDGRSNQQTDRQTELWTKHSVESRCTRLKMMIRLVLDSKMIVITTVGTRSNRLAFKGSPSRKVNILRSQIKFLYDFTSL